MVGRFVVEVEERMPVELVHKLGVVAAVHRLVGEGVARKPVEGAGMVVAEGERSRSRRRQRRLQNRARRSCA